MSRYVIIHHKLVYSHKILHNYMKNYIQIHTQTQARCIIVLIYSEACDFQKHNYTCNVIQAQITGLYAQMAF